MKINDKYTSELQELFDKKEFGLYGDLLESIFAKKHYEWVNVFVPSAQVQRPYFLSSGGFDFNSPMELKRSAFERVSEFIMYVFFSLLFIAVTVFALVTMATSDSIPWQLVAGALVGLLLVVYFVATSYERLSTVYGYKADVLIDDKGVFFHGMKEPLRWDSLVRAFVFSQVADKRTFYSLVLFTKSSREPMEIVMGNFKTPDGKLSLGGIFLAGFIQAYADYHSGGKGRS